MEMKCFRRLLYISYRYCIDNEEVRNGIKHAVKIKHHVLWRWKRNLKWYGPVRQSQGLTKQSCRTQWSEGKGHSHGRSWENYISAWTHLKLRKHKEPVGERRGIRNLVDMSSVEHQCQQTNALYTMGSKRTWFITHNTLRYWMWRCPVSPCPRLEPPLGTHTDRYDWSRRHM